jgi:hypothetical protein
VLSLLLFAATVAPVHARLVPPADRVIATRSATATVVVSGARRAPRVRFALDDTTVTATGRATPRRGRYAVRFTLPRGGAWSYRITVGRRAAGSGRLEVAPLANVTDADARAICAAAGSFWPTQTLARDAGSTWVACKGLGLLQRLDPSARIRVGGSSLVAVQTGFGSVWALDASRSGTLIRIDPARNVVTTRIALATSAAYNIWVGAGSIWVAGDQAAEVVRVDPVTNAVIAHIRVGDGPADMVFDGDTGWVIDHRDRTLFKIDTRANAGALVGTIPGDAPERMALVRDHLWITGRGTDLIELDPTRGTVLRTVEIGAGGIDVVASGNSLWVPVRSAENDQRGLPAMETLARIDARTGTVLSSFRSRGAVDVHGLVADADGVSLADNTHGVLYRVRG